MPDDSKNGNTPVFFHGKEPPPDLAGFTPPLRNPGLRLLLIPGLIYLVWVLDTFLLEGSQSVYIRSQPLVLVLYTLIANVFLGIIVPVVSLRPAFLSGAVNMFQLGFRPARRSSIAILVTSVSCYILIVLFTPYGMERLSLLSTFALMLPAGIASVMVCWVLLGTHIQAYTREYGAAVSIIAGVLVTGFLFGLSFAAHSLNTNQPSWYLRFVLIGFAAAVFFFAVRDVPSSAVFITFLICPAVHGTIDPGYTASLDPVVFACAALSVLTLAACYRYLSKRFVTVEIPVRITPG